MGRSKAAFEGITYKHYTTHPTSHELEAVHPKTGDSIAYMRWNKGSGTIEDVSVDKEHRRKGVATGMYRHAIALAKATGIAAPVHSPVRTPDGAAWAEAVR